MQSLRRWLLFISLFLLAACDSSRIEHEVGVVATNDSTFMEEVLSIPDDVQAGVPFDVTVRTFGGGCTEAGNMEQEVAENLAVLKPYDLAITPGRNVVCPSIITRPEHTAQITFESGPATIRVEGRSEGEANMTGGAEGGPAVVEKTINVKPRTVRQVSIIQSDALSNLEVILAPNTVQAGVPFEVTVQTVGGGCLEADGVDIKLEERLAVIVPYDLDVIPDENGDCPADIGPEPHFTQLTFNELGSATVGVKGRRKDYPATGEVEGQAVVEKIIQVK